MRILLLQARTEGDPTRVEERESFARHSGVETEAIEPWDLLEGPPSLADLAPYDAVMVGGAGEFYVSKGDLPHQERFFDLLLELTVTGPPTFASCFGFQCLVEAAGGEIVHDAEGLEVGTYPLELTAAGQADPLFGHLPHTFLAQMGRKDRATRLPDGWQNLASSSLCPFQATRVPGRPFWASQFHPELDQEGNLGRFKRYLDGYAAAMTEQEKYKAFDNYQPTPETAEILTIFLDLVRRG